jgi:group I intron endonuclease
MYYTIYKITNKINGKHYIGMHKTSNLDDGYMGSGKFIRRAILKHGLENFTKEILHVFDNEQDMKNKEKELVILGEMSYNLCDGGKGGFGYINRSNLNNSKNQCSLGGKTIAALGGGFKNKKHTQESKNNISLNNKGKQSFLGKKHSSESKNKIGLKNSVSQQGSKNSQYGTYWVTDGSKNHKIKKEELDFWLNRGYYKGRIIGVRI